MAVTKPNGSRNPSQNHESDPKPERQASERARRAWRRSLKKARRVRAKNCRARRRALRQERIRLEKERLRQERARRREAERWERGLQKKLARGREHGFFLFRYWCLFVIPFTKTLERLGENVEQFRRLAEVFERWLVPRLVPAAPHDEAAGLRSPSWFRWIAQKAARALAQVAWLEERYIRLYARERAIRLEARLKVAAEMQATLRGEQGAEAQAELEGKLAVLLGLTPEERKQAPPEEKLDHLYAIWPARFGRRLAEVIVDAVMDGPERRWSLTRLRCRVELLLAAHRTAEQLMTEGAGDQLPASVKQLITGDSLPGNGNPQSSTDNRSPAAGSRPDGSSLKRACAELRVKILELERKVRELRQLERIGASVLDAPQIEELKGHKKRFQEQIRELRIWRRKLNELATVESQSVENLGNPFAPGVNGTHPPSELIRPGEPYRLHRPGSRPVGQPQGTSESGAENAEVPPEARPETRLEPIVPGELDARADPEAVALSLAAADRERSEMPPEERERAEERDRSLAAKRGETVAELRRARAEQPQLAGALLRWQPATGLELKVRNWHLQRWTRVGRTAAAGDQAWWPEARELELVAELRARRNRDGSSLGYVETKRLLAAALGLVPVQDPGQGTPAQVVTVGAFPTVGFSSADKADGQGTTVGEAHGQEDTDCGYPVRTPELNGALERVARLLWTTVGIQPRRAARNLGKLAGAGRTPPERTCSGLPSETSAEPNAKSETEAVLAAFQRAVDDGSEIEGELQGRGGFQTRPYGAETENGAETHDEFESEGALPIEGGSETESESEMEDGSEAGPYIAEPESNLRSARLYVALGQLLVAMHGDLPEFYPFRPDSGGEEE